MLEENLILAKGILFRANISNCEKFGYKVRYKVFIYFALFRDRDGTATGEFDSIGFGVERVTNVSKFVKDFFLDKF